jgi:hypothetical protein
MFKYIVVALLVAVSYFAFFYDAALTNESIGNLFIAGIMACFLLFAVFKFGLHYKISAIDRFAVAFYYSVFEYRKAQKEPSRLSYVESLREQAEVALTASFDASMTTSSPPAGSSPQSGKRWTRPLKIPVTLYSRKVKDPFLDKLRARIHEAEGIKLQARQLEGKANVLLGEAEDMLVEEDIVEKPSGSLLDRMFEIEDGVAHIVDLTVDELVDQSYDQTPDYDIITHIALDNNPYFTSTYRYFASEDMVGILFRAPFMVILLGIIGTFAGFYLALGQGGDIKSGASVAIVSSLVGLPVSLLMDYINTLFPDRGRYQQAFNKYKVGLEMLFNHEKELNAISAVGGGPGLVRD